MSARWHQHGVRHADQATVQQQQQRANDFCLVDHRPFDDVSWGMLAGARCAVSTHQEQVDDHGDVADGIGGKAPASPIRALEYRDMVDDACALRHRRIQRDGVISLLCDHVDNEGLAAGMSNASLLPAARQHKDVQGWTTAKVSQARMPARIMEAFECDHQALAIDAVA